MKGLSAMANPEKLTGSDLVLTEAEHLVRPSMSPVDAAVKNRMVISVDVFSSTGCNGTSRAAPVLPTA